jgi:hypothetical protein
MSLILPDNVRGPILDLTLPASTDALDIVFRNATTGKTLTINLPAEWDGDDLTLDWLRRTITDQTGADRSALLDPGDNDLWGAREPLAGGSNDLEIEAVQPITRSPGTLANDAGFGTKVWSNPGNAAASDDKRASVFAASTEYSQYLKATNYGFSLTGATILGFAPGIECTTSGITAVERVRLVIGGVVQGVDLNGEETPNLPAAETVLSYGGNGQLFESAPSGAQVSASDFGFVFAVAGKGGGASQAMVDHMPMTVYAATTYGAKATLRWEKGYS